MRGSALALVSLLSLTAQVQAQDRGVPADSPRPAITMPAGTRLFTIVERPINRRTTRVGDPVYLQVAHPVVVHDTVVVPGGTYIEGILDQLAPGPGRIRARLRLHLTRIVYGNGYVVATSDSALGRAREGVEGDPTPASSVAWLGAIGLGAGAGTLAGRTGRTRGALVGVGVTLGAFALGMAFVRDGVALEEGAPVELELQRPLVLDARRALAPGATAFVPRPRLRPPRDGLCYSPGTPGTSDTVIPGTPGTPDIVIPGAPGTPDVVVPGTPGTPATVIPGSPGTPDSWYPCRR